MRSQARLAELYMEVGRRDDARAIVDDLERLLVLADSDFPLVTRVRRLRDTPWKQPPVRLPDVAPIVAVNAFRAVVHFAFQAP